MCVNRPMISRHLSVFFLFAYISYFKSKNSDWAAKKAPASKKSTEIPTKMEPVATLLYKNTHTKVIVRATTQHYDLWYNNNRSLRKTAFNVTARERAFLFVYLFFLKFSSWFYFEAEDSNRQTRSIVICYSHKGCNIQRKTK